MTGLEEKSFGRFLTFVSTYSCLCIYHAKYSRVTDRPLIPTPRAHDALFLQERTVFWAIRPYSTCTTALFGYFLPYWPPNSPLVERRASAAVWAGDLLSSSYPSLLRPGKPMQLAKLHLHPSIRVSRTAAPLPGRYQPGGGDAQSGRRSWLRGNSWRDPLTAPPLPLPTPREGGSTDAGLVTLDSQPHFLSAEPGSLGMASPMGR